MTGSVGFDPLALLDLVERAHLEYVVIGAVARVIRGSGEQTWGLDIVPSVTDRNQARLSRLPGEVGELADGDTRPVQVETPHGHLRLVPAPWGTRGYDDLRWRASREHLGGILRPQIASVVDLTRMLEASPRPEDRERLQRLYRLMELERRLGLDRGLDR